MRRAAEVSTLLVVLALVAAPLYYTAYQAQKTRRFEIGSMDRDFLADARLFHVPGAMSGPIRRSDKSVEVLDFYGRLTRREARLSLPYLALRSPLHLFIRCHRFGLGGVVTVVANGHVLGDFTFSKSSYPWAGIDTTVPQAAAEKGPLQLELLTTGGDPPPSHLAQDLGVGLDVIEVEPMSKAARLIPSLSQFGALFAFMAFGFGFLWLTGFSPYVCSAIVFALLIGVCGLTWLFPVEASIALSRLWIAFPLGAALHCGLRYAAGRALIPRAGPAELSFISRLFVLATLAHSVLIFFPNHAPPDVPLHGIQVGWLESLGLSYDSLRLYSRLVSRRTTAIETVMDTRSEAPPQSLTDADETGSSITTPYPPFFYLFTFVVSRAHHDVRFLLEFIPVLFGSLMVVLTFLMARAIREDDSVARFAALLLALEISLWHHAHRGHGPGLFGALFVLSVIAFLVLKPEALQNRKGVAALVLGSFWCALCYTMAFVQMSLFMVVLGLVVGLGALSKENRSDGLFLRRLLAGFTAGAAVATAAYYAPYFLPAFRQPGMLLGGEDYRPPAAFFFLRNQVRDSVRILLNGYPVYVAFSLVGLLFLGSRRISRRHRQILGAALVTYVAMLLLKDPALFPRLLLFAKEELFYAPFACLLSALPMAALWRMRWGRPAAVTILLGLLSLQIRDQAFSANTLYQQPVP